MPVPIARWNPQRMIWETDQIDLFSGLSEPYSETFATSGVMRPDGSLWPLPQSALPIAASEFLLLPSPVAQQSGSTPEEHLARKPGRTQVTDLAIIVEHGLM
jgi:hypothetical protein